MANEIKKVPGAPFKARVIDARGFITNQWIAFFDILLRRVGSKNPNGNFEITEVGLTEELETDLTNIETNISSMQSSVSSLQSSISSLQSTTSSLDSRVDDLEEHVEFLMKAPVPE